MLVAASILMGRKKIFFGLEVDSSGNGKEETEKRDIERRMKWMVAAEQDDEAIVSIS